MPRSGSIPHSIDIYVGGRLRAARLSSGFNQNELARALNVSFQQVQKYEQGTNRISASVIMMACIALKVTPSSLFPSVEDAEIDKFPTNIDAYLGGTELANCYAQMSTERRSLILGTAKAFV